MSIGSWIAKMRLERGARKMLKGAFRSSEALKGTSLKPHHAGRAVVVDYEAGPAGVARVWFGIVRHPRPYVFSRQSHKVLEYYIFDAAANRVSRIEGRNLTRSAGNDADDAR